VPSWIKKDSPHLESLAATLCTFSAILFLISALLRWDVDGSAKWHRLLMSSAFLAIAYSVMIRSDLRAALPARVGTALLVFAALMCPWR
jgi:hypothetical protein